MATRTQKKTTKRKQASTAQAPTAMGMKWKPSQPVTATRATGVVESSLSEKEKSKTHGLKVLNDLLAIKEDAIDFEVDTPSGMTKTVVDSLKSGLLVIPEQGEFYAKKYPCRGEVVAVGSKVKHVEVGNKVVFARMGGMREQIDGQNYVFIREFDVFAVIS